MQVNIQINSAELDNVLAKLTRLNMRSLFGIIAEEMTLSHQERWGKSVAPDGSAWAPLKPKTIARKSTPFPLVETGVMIGNGLVSQINDNEMKIGLSDPKALWHHTGTSRGIPARPLVGVGPEDEKTIEEVTLDWIEDLIGN